jgi:hypothetical protein
MFLMIYFEGDIVRIDAHMSEWESIEQWKKAKNRKYQMSF